MNTKKIIILVFALVVLVGAILFATRKVIDKNQKAAEPNLTENSGMEKKKETKLFGQEGQGKNVVSVSGNVSVISEKTLTIKTQSTPVVVNINGATPVMTINSNNNSTIAQIADLKVGDAVRLTYDQVSGNATVIYLIRP